MENEKKVQFNKDDKGQYVAQYVSSGTTAIQINRTECAPLRVLASIGSMTPIVVVKFGDDSPKDLIFELNIVPGVNVTIISKSEVKEAAMIEA